MVAKSEVLMKPQNAKEIVRVNGKLAEGSGFQKTAAIVDKPTNYVYDIYLIRWSKINRHTKSLKQQKNVKFPRQTRCLRFKTTHFRK